MRTIRLPRGAMGPTMPVTIETDREALDQAALLQEKSKEATRRIQQQLQETQDVGAMTLDDLYERRRQLDAIEEQGRRLDEKLAETQELHTRLGGIFSFLQRVNHVGVKGVAPLPEEPSTIYKKRLVETHRQRGWKPSMNAGKKKDKAKTEENTQGLLPVHPNSIPSEHANHIHALDKADKELDDELDMIGRQLETMKRMADEIGDEAHNQGKQIGRVRNQLAGAQVRQQQVDEKTRRLLREGTGAHGDKGFKMLSFIPW
jgi:hypothetical protein